MLPSRWIRYCHEQGCPPTVAAMARDLTRPNDSVATHLACVWIASKFEEVEPFTQAMLREEAGLPRYLDLRQQEAAVLARVDWCLPFRTAARAILHLLAERHAFYDEAVHALLVAGVDGALSPEAWAHVLRHARTKVRVHPLLQLVAMLTGFRRVKRKALRPRLSWCKRR
jgi:hypothetical protein